MPGARSNSPLMRMLTIPLMASSCGSLRKTEEQPSQNKGDRNGD
jgi:hypothetical protein